MEVWHFRMTGVGRKGTTENPLAWMANNPLSNKKYKLLSTFYAGLLGKESDNPFTAKC